MAAAREITAFATLQTPVGDDACIVPETLRRRKRSRADMESAPTDDGKASGRPEKRTPATNARPRRRPTNKTNRRAHPNGKSAAVFLIITDNVNPHKPHSGFLAILPPLRG